MDRASVKEIMEDYRNVVDQERGMRREVQRLVFDDPKTAEEVGLIRRTIVFAFPTPSRQYRQDLLDRLNR